jgi:hypothetical protein
MLSLYNWDVGRRSADPARMNEAANRGGLSECLRMIECENNPNEGEMTQSAIAKTNQNPEIRA